MVWHLVCRQEEHTVALTYCQEPPSALLNMAPKTKEERKKVVLSASYVPVIVRGSE